jgi:uncharacterized protein with NAD-binding domain and iron-sulfur cluster
LKDQGVDYHLGALVTAIQFADGRIVGVTVQEERTERQVTADYYVAALPIERIVELISEPMRQADPNLDRLYSGYKSQQLRTEWMNGIQFFLKQDVPLVPGHTLYIDSAWSLTSISQVQFWPGTDLTTYGDGTVQGVLSVDISDWHNRGLNGKTAMECSTKGEIKDEVLAQIQQHLHSAGLEEANLATWFLDEDIVYPNPPGVPVNLEPLLVNTAGSYHYRPEAVTQIPNLFLAGDYVRTNTDLATMEAANEAARRAVNGILKAARSRARRCTIWKLQEPWIFQPLLWFDRLRFAFGLPNVFDAEQSRPVRWALRALLGAWRGVYLCWEGYHSMLRWFGMS